MSNSVGGIKPPLPVASSGEQLACWPMTGGHLAVHQNSDYRWLYFPDGSSTPPEQTPVQSIMRLARPAELVLPYMQRMVMWLACFPAQRALNIVQLGLGAGAIARWLSQLPVAHQLVSVDNSAEVIRCYHQYFQPEAATRDNSALHRVVQADAAGYLADCEADSCDLLLVDLYDGTGDDGLPSSIVSAHFVRGLFKCMSPDALAVINVAHGHSQSLQILFNELRWQCGYLSLMTVPGFENVLAVVSQKPDISPGAKSISLLQPYLAANITTALDEAVVVQGQSIKKN